MLFFCKHFSSHSYTIPISILHAEYWHHHCAVTAICFRRCTPNPNNHLLLHTKFLYVYVMPVIFWYPFPIFLRTEQFITLNPSVVSLVCGEQGNSCGGAGANVITRKTTCLNNFRSWKLCPSSVMSSSKCSQKKGLCCHTRQPALKSSAQKSFTYLHIDSSVIKVFHWDTAYRYLPSRLRHVAASYVGIHAPM